MVGEGAYAIHVMRDLCLGIVSGRLGLLHPWTPSFWCNSLKAPGSSQGLSFTTRCVSADAHRNSFCRLSHLRVRRWKEKAPPKLGQKGRTSSCPFTLAGQHVQIGAAAPLGCALFTTLLKDETNVCLKNMSVRFT